MQDDETSPAPRRQLPIKTIMSLLTILPAVLVLFGTALGAAGGYVSGLLVAALSRSHPDWFDGSRAPEIGAAIGALFFVFAFTFQYLRQRK